MMKFFCWSIVPLTVLTVVCSALAADNGIGDFDIDKVRQASHINDTASGDSALPAADRESMTTIALRMTLYLGIVIVLILISAWFFRKKSMQMVRGGGGGAMDVIETLSLGQNRMLVMVRVMDEIYLVSQTATAVTLLDKIGGQKALDIISASKGGGTILTFKDAFNNFMGKIKKPV